jgi:uncharacterized protein with HEPN domain
MRPRDPRASIAEAIAAGEAIGRFTAGKAFDDYIDDELLASGVERQFEIIGEALSRTLRALPSLGERIPEAADAIGFRNVLAHGYDTVSDTLVWSIAQDKLPHLLEQLRAALEELS